MRLVCGDSGGKQSVGSGPSYFPPGPFDLGFRAAQWLLTPDQQDVSKWDAFLRWLDETQRAAREAAAQAMENLAELLDALGDTQVQVRGWVEVNFVWVKGGVEVKALTDADKLAAAIRKLAAGIKPHSPPPAAP